MTQWIKWGSTAYALTSDGTLNTRTHSVALMRGKPAVLLCWRKAGQKIIGRVEYPSDDVRKCDGVRKWLAMREARQICESDWQEVAQDE